MKKIMIKPGIDGAVEIKNGSIVIKASPGQVLEVSDKAFQIAIAADAFIDADTVPATKKGRKPVDPEKIDDVLTGADETDEDRNERLEARRKSLFVERL